MALSQPLPEQNVRNLAIATDLTTFIYRQESGKRAHVHGCTDATLVPRQRQGSTCSALHPPSRRSELQLERPPPSQLRHWLREERNE